MCLSGDSFDLMLMRIETSLRNHYSQSTELVNKREYRQLSSVTKFHFLRWYNWYNTVASKRMWCWSRIYSLKWNMLRGIQRLMLHCACVFSNKCIHEMCLYKCCIELLRVLQKIFDKDTRRRSAKEQCSMHIGHIGNICLF